MSFIQENGFNKRNRDIYWKVRSGTESDRQSGKIYMKVQEISKVPSMLHSCWILFDVLFDEQLSIFMGHHEQAHQVQTPRPRQLKVNTHSLRYFTEKLL
jgi:hypothetical protein